MAIEISDAIKIKLNDYTRVRLTDVKSVNPDVFELWMKGMTEIGKYNPESMQKSVVYFKQATDDYPGDARAWAGYAEGLVNLGHSPAQQSDTWSMAERAAIIAIQLDSTLAEAYASLAHTKTYFGWDYEEAESYYAKANELNPNLAMNHYHYSWQRGIRYSG